MALSIDVGVAWQIGTSLVGIGACVGIARQSQKTNDEFRADIRAEVAKLEETNLVAVQRVEAAINKTETADAVTQQRLIGVEKQQEYTTRRIAEVNDALSRRIGEVADLVQRVSDRDAEQHTKNRESIAVLNDRQKRTA